MILRTRRKGVGHWYDEHLEVIDALGSAWYYNWGPRPAGGANAVKAEFVPMIWNGAFASVENLAHVKTAGYKALLGFNEPDLDGHANMTVDEAVEYWPKLEATGLRLGSPAPSVSPWLHEFMAKAGSRRLRVDFLCLHWYGDILKPDPVGDFRRFLERHCERYRLPIWLTEFSGPAVPGRIPSVDDNARFAAESVAMLESLPFVECYAWFAPLVPADDDFVPTVALCAPDGSLTPVGLAWRVAPGGP